MDDDYTFEEFKAVVESEAYEKRFRSRESVIYLQNGGPEFHNEETLTRTLEEYQSRLNKKNLSNRDRWIAENMVGKVRSWLKQSIWIHEQMELNRRNQGR